MKSTLWLAFVSVCICACASTPLNYYQPPTGPDVATISGVSTGVLSDSSLYPWVVDGEPVRSLSDGGVALKPGARRVLVGRRTGSGSAWVLLEFDAAPAKAYVIRHRQDRTFGDALTGSQQPLYVWLEDAASKERLLEPREVAVRRESPPFSIPIFVPRGS